MDPTSFSTSANTFESSSFSYKDLVAAKEALLGAHSHRVGHMDVVESTNLPVVGKITLSPDFDACSPQFKRDFNKWLLDMFGPKEFCYVVGNTVICSPITAAKLRQDTKLQMNTLPSVADR